MQTLDISYSTFKTLAVAPIKIYYSVDPTGAYYYLSAATDHHLLCATATGPDAVDFAATLKSTAVEVGSKDDALALGFYANNGNAKVTPKTSDGKTVVLPNLFPGNVFLYITGVGDDSTTVGAGPDFKLTSTGVLNPCTEDLVFGFRDWCYLAGGGVFYENATTGDKISMKLYAPATTTTAAAGGNTGNCNKVALGGGLNMIVPAAGDGTHNLGATVTPVPSYDEENGETPVGYWDWSNPDTGVGTVSANPGAGKWNLFDFDMDLVCFVRNLQLVGNGSNGNFDITVPAIKPKKILPQWKFKVSLCAVAGHTVKAGWYMVTARRKTL